jgi:hypothetical protein
MTRRLLVLIASAGLVVLAVAGPTSARTARKSHARFTFAPYTDMTLYPAPNLVQIKRASGVRQISLGFVVAGSGSACTPTWGGYPADRASGTKAYRLANVRAFRHAGGQAVISFGGEAGSELATVCPDLTALTNAYSSAVAAYHPRRVDFDIEGKALENSPANQLRSQALAALQRRYKGLAISLTLPVLPSGLQPDALGVIRSAVAHGVHVRYVNLMAMDYGASAAPHPTGHMGRYAISAAQRAAGQLHRIYPHLSMTARLAKLGVTPMIGVNDVSSERFTLADARTLATFARRHRLGLLSMWDLSRDRACAKPGGAAQDSCSGVRQRHYAFSKLFLP